MKHLINTDEDAKIPSRYNWTVENHKGMGVIDWKLIKPELYLSEEQKGGRIVGNELRKELEGKNVLNANVLDYLLEHAHLIPKEWKDKYVYFWGTVYRDRDGGLYVRYLYFPSKSWSWNYNWLGNGFHSYGPAAVAGNVSFKKPDNFNLEITEIKVNGKTYKLTE